MGILNTMSSALDTAGGYVKESLKAGAMQVNPDINDFYTYQEMKEDPRSFANMENLARFKNPNSEYRKLAVQKSMDIQKQLAEILSIAQMEPDPKKRAVMAYAADYLVGGDQYRRIFGIPDDAADDVRNEEYYKIAVDSRRQAKELEPLHGPTDWAKIDYKKVALQRPVEPQPGAQAMPQPQGNAILPQQGAPQQPSQPQIDPNSPEGRVAADQARQRAIQENNSRIAMMPGGMTPELAKLNAGSKELARVQGAADKTSDSEIQQTAILHGKRVAANDPELLAAEKRDRDLETAEQKKRAENSAAVTRKNRKDMRADDSELDKKELLDLGYSEDEIKKLKKAKVERDYLGTPKAGKDPGEGGKLAYFRKIGKRKAEISEALRSGKIKVKTVDKFGTGTTIEIPVPDSPNPKYPGVDRASLKKELGQIDQELNGDDVSGIEVSEDEVKELFAMANGAESFDALPEDRKKLYKAKQKDIIKAYKKGAKQHAGSQFDENVSTQKNNDAPPVEGAQRAKDGFWYVKGKNGKYQKVIQ